MARTGFLVRWWRQRRAVAEAARPDLATGDGAREAAPALARQPPAVPTKHGRGAPDPPVIERRPARVEDHRDEARRREGHGREGDHHPGGGGLLGPVFGDERLHHVDSRLALREGQGLRGVGDDGELDGGDGRRGAPAVVAPLEAQQRARLRARDRVGTGAGGHRRADLARRDHLRTSASARSTYPLGRRSTMRRSRGPPTFSAAAMSASSARSLGERELGRRAASHGRLRVHRGERLAVGEGHALAQREADLGAAHHPEGLGQPQEVAVVAAHEQRLVDGVLGDLQRLAIGVAEEVEGLGIGGEADAQGAGGASSAARASALVSRGGASGVAGTSGVWRQGLMRAGGPSQAVATAISATMHPRRSCAFFVAVIKPAA